MVIQERSGTAVGIHIGKLLIVGPYGWALINFLPHPLRHHIPVHTDVIRIDADAASFPGLPDPVCRCHHDLCRNAAPVEAGAAEPAPFDNRHRQPLRQGSVGHNIAGSCADDNDIVVLHGNPPYFLFGKVQKFLTIFIRIYIYSMIEKAPFGKGRVLRFRHRRLAVTGGKGHRNHRHPFFFVHLPCCGTMV